MSSRRAAVLVHDWLTVMRGGEKVLEALGELFPDAPIYTLFHFSGSVSPAIERHPIHTSSLQRAPALRRYYRYYLPLFPHAIERLRLPETDLVVSSSHCVAKGVIPPRGARHVCYCHTPVRYAWDQQGVYFPDDSGLVARSRSRLLARLRRWDAATADRVDVFLANSSFVAERIRRYYGREAAVVAPPVDVDFFTPGPGAREDFALCVSALSPYKRIDVAIDACARLGIELRVVGEGPERKQLERRAGAGAKFLGHVDAETLRALYQGASCFVQPGVEDFGIASVEALACGCPVVACEVGGVRDIVESGRNGRLYDPGGGVSAAAEAIDTARSARFDAGMLRRSAAHFSADHFREALRPHLRG